MGGLGGVDGGRKRERATEEKREMFSEKRGVDVRVMWEERCVEEEEEGGMCKSPPLKCAIRVCCLAVWMPVYLRRAVLLSCRSLSLSLSLSPSPCPVVLSVLNSDLASLNTNPPPRDVFIPAASLSRPKKADPPSLCTSVHSSLASSSHPGVELCTNSSVGKLLITSGLVCVCVCVCLRSH